MLPVFPLQYHSYTVDNASKVEIFVFSPRLISEFDEMVSGKKPISSLFCAEDIPSFPEDSSKILCIKAFFYDLCHKLYTRIRLSDGESTGKQLSLLDKLFLFVDRNFSGDCSLSDAAKELKYDYTYLSKLFKSKTGMSYNAYVNHFRVGHATYLLFNSDKSITEIAEELGFQTLQHFSAVFLKATGISPRKYRQMLSRQ